MPATAAAFMPSPQRFASSAQGSAGSGSKAAAIEREGEAKAIFIAALDGQIRRVESAGFGDYELAASWIRKRSAGTVALEDRVRDAP